MATASRELALPFHIDPNGAVATTRSRSEILVNHVTSVLGTQPTERGMRPEYGCDLQRFAFSLGDSVVISDMSAVCRTAMTAFCPEARFLKLTAVPPDANGIFIVSVQFTDATDPRDNPLVAVLEFAVQSEGGDVTEEGFDG